MKVFNWVRWKFPHHHSNPRKENGVEKNEIRRSSKGMDIDHDDKHILLDDHVVNNWDHQQDGLILAIGTLGAGPFVGNMQYSHFPDHDQDGPFDHDHIHDDDDLLSSTVHSMMFTHELEKDGNGCNEIEEVFNEDDDIVRRRVTLADLFSESSNSDSDSDSDHDHHDDDHKEVVEKEKNITFVQKNSIFGLKKKKGFIKGNKLFKEDFRPLYVFNKLMKRMMKKRIHPDMEGKMKKEIQMQQTQIDDDHDSASSVLLIQDAMV